MANMINCKSCGQEIASSAKTCPHCGAKNKKPIFKKWWFWAIIVFAAIGIIAASTSGNEGGGAGNNPGGNSGTGTGDRTGVFAGDCGISVTAEMGTDIIGQPTISLSIKNESNKDISAIKFFVVPYNVYGEVLNDWLTQERLSTDSTIKAGETDTRTWQFLDDNIKTIDLYVYSVYFSDSTEWGDKEATKTVILKNAIKINVDGESD